MHKQWNKGLCHLQCKLVRIFKRLISKELLDFSSEVVPPTAASGWVFLRRLLWPAKRRRQLLFPSSNSWRWWNLYKQLLRAHHSVKDILNIKLSINYTEINKWAPFSTSILLWTNSEDVASKDNGSCHFIVM